jgi:predicted membrane protein
MSGKNTIGLILVGLGIGFFLHQAGIIDFQTLIVSYWPTIIIVIGVIQLFNKSISTISSIITILVGSLLQAYYLGALSANLTNYIWPSLLVFTGLWFIFTKKNIDRITTNTQDTVNYVAVFSGIETKNASQQFQGGYIAAFFGGTDVDLREANLSAEGATLELTTAFGGVSLKVPRHWKVVVTGVPVFGGWENSTEYDEHDLNLKTLHIKCFAAFGGIEIKN